jgi:hypothetical protein
MERALAFQGLLPDEADRLVAVIRRIVPHGQPELQDAMMDTALALDAQMVGNLGFRAEVRKGLADLEERAQTSHRASFVELKPDDQSAILRSIESTPFFQNLVHLTRVLQPAHRLASHPVSGHGEVAGPRRLSGQGLRQALLVGTGSPLNRLLVGRR